jgi:hypothetical protein
MYNFVENCSKFKTLIRNIESRMRDNCMCKEMPVIPVNRVVDKKRVIGKMEGRGGGEAQGVAAPATKKLKAQK